VLVATRERLPRGWLAGMTFSRNGTRTNVRTRDERDPETDGAQPMRASAVKRGRDPRFPYIPVVVRENGTHNTNTRKAFTTRAEAVAFAQDWIDHARRVLAIAAARRAARHAGTDA
ncbi:MAG TPA: hypothetical protein VN903_31875, partial [Polyangia bacterium]|nr:hypothetical protein [Polyangia bacterium]